MLAISNLGFRKGLQFVDGGVVSVEGHRCPERWCRVSKHQ
jgi:hypothetical protein